MKLILSKEINEEILTRVEYLNHLKSSYQFIMNEVLRQRSKYKYNKENVNYYMNKFSETMTEFKLLSNEIIKDIDEKYLDNKKYYSEYDFEERNVKIYEI